MIDEDKSFSITKSTGVLRLYKHGNDGKERIEVIDIRDWERVDIEWSNQ